MSNFLCSCPVDLRWQGLCLVTTTTLCQWDGKLWVRSCDCAPVECLAPIHSSISPFSCKLTLYVLVTCCCCCGRVNARARRVRSSHVLLQMCVCVRICVECACESSENIVSSSALSNVPSSKSYLRALAALVTGRESRARCAESFIREQSHPADQ